MTIVRAAIAATGVIEAIEAAGHLGATTKDGKLLPRPATRLAKEKANDAIR